MEELESLCCNGGGVIVGDQSCRGELEVEGERGAGDAGVDGDVLSVLILELIRERAASSGGDKMPSFIAVRIAKYCLKWLGKEGRGGGGGDGLVLLSMVGCLRSLVGRGLGEHLLDGGVVEFVRRVLSRGSSQRVIKPYALYPTPCTLYPRCRRRG